MQTLRELPGFNPGTKPQPSLKPGAYPAYMQPIHEVLETANGEAVKVRYLVAYKGPGFWRGTEISELCNAPFHADPKTGEKIYDFTENSKYTLRLAAVNGVEAKNLDLGRAERGGWIMVNVIRDPKNDQYFKLDSVMPLPDGFDVPRLRTGPSGFVQIDNSGVPDAVARNNSHMEPEGGHDDLPF